MSLGQWIAHWATNPNVIPVETVLVLVAIHALLGIGVHAFKLKDFELRQVGNYVLTDLMTTKGGLILITFVGAVITSGPPTSWNAHAIEVMYGPAYVSLLGACIANSVGIVHDTYDELVYLLTNVPTGKYKQIVEKRKVVPLNTKWN